jgi:hypothetical protein
MTNQEYREAEGISSSDFRLLEISPKHLEHKDRFPLGSKSLTFGTALHSMVLEPDKFKDEYVTAPKFDLRTNKGKEEKRLFEEEHQGKTVLKSDEIDTLVQMAKNVNAIAGGILQGGIAESSIFVKDDLEFTRKCRPDYYIENAGIVIDLKTTRSCKPYDFQKSIFDYSYHRQAAWYMDTLKLSGKPANTFIIIAVEKSSPHMVRVYQIKDEAIEKGREEYQALLEDYKKYIDTGVAEVVKPISLPKWAFDEEREV